MANRRMIHKNISISKEVNSMSEFAQLLFTWAVPHLDDFGKISGDPAVIKAQVMPMNPRPINDVEDAIIQMENNNLIEIYDVDDKRIIRYLKFEDYQTGLHKRTDSKFPDNPRKSNKQSEVLGNSSPTEQNGSEENITEEKITTANRSGLKNISANNKINSVWINPRDFTPTNEIETAALEAWKKIEPHNPFAFHTTYHYAYRKGLPANLFYEYTSELEQDNSINNKGAVFKKKVEEYLKQKNKI